MSDSEADLLARIGLRDRAAFAAFYESTSGRIFALVLRTLSNRALAEEALQEIYLSVWYNADRFRPQALATPDASANAWLVTIARNKAIDLLRNKGNQMTSSNDVAEPAADEVELGARAMDNPRLQICLGELEDLQRQSIFAAFFGGLTHAEISSRFDAPIGTIKSRIRRGLVALKGCLSV